MLQTLCKNFWTNFCKKFCTIVCKNFCTIFYTCLHIDFAIYYEIWRYLVPIQQFPGEFCINCIFYLEMCKKVCQKICKCEKNCVNFFSYVKLAIFLHFSNLQSVFRPREDTVTTVSFTIAAVTVSKYLLSLRQCRYSTMSTHTYHSKIEILIPLLVNLGYHLDKPTQQQSLELFLIDPIHVMLDEHISLILHSTRRR